jgi:hypothetical protein
MIQDRKSSPPEEAERAPGAKSSEEWRGINGRAISFASHRSAHRHEHKHGAWRIGITEIASLAFE